MYLTIKTIFFLCHCVSESRILFRFPSECHLIRYKRLIFFRTLNYTIAKINYKLKLDYNSKGNENKNRILQNNLQQKKTAQKEKFTEKNLYRQKTLQRENFTEKKKIFRKKILQKEVNLIETEYFLQDLCKRKCNC